MKKPDSGRISISQAAVLPQDQAKAALESIRQLRGQIDGLEIPTTTALKRLRGTATIPSDFLEQVAIVLDESQPVSQATGVTPKTCETASRWSTPGPPSRKS